MSFFVLYHLLTYHTSGVDSMALPANSLYIFRTCQKRESPFVCHSFFVLNFRRFSSPQMADGFMVFENVLHLIGKIRVDFRQPFGQIFMHRALGDTKFLGNRTDRIPCFHDTATDFDGPFLDVIVHAPASLLWIVWYII